MDDRDIGSLVEVHEKVLQAVNELISTGRQLFNNGATDMSLRYFETASQIWPASAEAQLWQGAVFHNRGEFRAAFELYAKSLEIDHDYALAHVNSAVLLIKDHAYERAIEHLNQAIAASPTFAEAYFYRALAYRLLHKSFNKLRRKFASLCEDLTDIKDFTQAIKFEPDFPQAHYERGVSFRMIGRDAEAIRDFNAALELEADYGAARREKSKALFSIGDIDGSIEVA